MEVISLFLFFSSCCSLLCILPILFLSLSMRIGETVPSSCLKGPQSLKPQHLHPLSSLRRRSLNLVGNSFFYNSPLQANFPFSRNQGRIYRALFMILPLWSWAKTPSRSSVSPSHWIQWRFDVLIVNSPARLRYAPRKAIRISWHRPSTWSNMCPTVSGLWVRLQVVKNLLPPFHKNSANPRFGWFQNNSPQARPFLSFSTHKIISPIHRHCIPFYTLPNQNAITQHAPSTP